MIQTVLISMMFNLGKKRFLTFKKFIKAIKDKDYEKAMYESVNSKRASQVPDRVKSELGLLIPYVTFTKLDSKVIDFFTKGV